jgi:hypothetical protein
MSRYVDYKKRCRRIPWDRYLLLAVVLWAGVLIGVLICSTVTGDADVAETEEPVATIEASAPADPVEEAIVPEELPEAPAEPAAPVEPETPAPYSEQELEMLALVIYQEAGGDACSDECRQMVGEVVLNRVADCRYPDTIYEVLTQYGQYGRLHWTGLVWPARADLPGEAHAVERAWHIAADLLPGRVERLLPEDVVFQAEFAQGTEIVAELDGLYFCR